MREKELRINRVEDTHRQRDHARRLSDLAFIMDTVEGRRFIVELLDECRVYKDNWTPSAEIHRFEGMRRVGLGILKKIEELGIGGLERYHIAQKEYLSLQMDEKLRLDVDIAKTTKED